jgi:hypothetical protein
MSPELHFCIYSTGKTNDRIVIMNTLITLLRILVLGALIGFAGCKPARPVDTTTPAKQAETPTPVRQAEALTPTGEADITTQRCFNTLLGAMTAGDYDQFVSVGDEKFRKLFIPTTFHWISQSLAPRFQRGCTPTYLGQLRQKGVQVSLWRLAFADGGDDRLARMSVSRDGVGGFLITPAF